MNNIYYIVGIKHCGKSTVGRALAQDLNLPYFDLDDLIEKAIGMSVREFYIQSGKDAFQYQEYLALETLKSDDSKGFVCATGGGICDNNKAVDILKTDTGIIFINTPLSIVYSRIIQNGIPPFLKSDDPKHEFSILYTKRTKLYKNIANIEISGEAKTPSQITKEILENLKEPENAGK